MRYAIALIFLAGPAHAHHEVALITVLPSVALMTIAAFGALRAAFASWRKGAQNRP